MTKNNWISTSLGDRSPENLCDFSITVNPYKFDFDSFENNSIRVANELADTYKNLYLLYSGGLDSEYVLKLFLDHNLPIIPVTMTYHYNKNELVYAVHFYKKHNIKPLIINYTKEELFKKSMDIAYKKGLYTFLGCIMLDACDIIADKGGTVLTGLDARTVLTHDNKYLYHPDESTFYLNEFTPNHIGSFFHYDLALYYSFLDELRPNKDMQISKSQLYKIPFRTLKTFWNYHDQEFHNFFREKRLNVKQFDIQIDVQKYKAALLNQIPTTFV